MKRNQLIAVAVAGAAALGGVSYLMTAGDGSVNQAVAQSSFDESLFSEETAAQLRENGYAIGPIPLGDPDAPVTIIEYARYDCPACRAFHENTLPAIKANYIDTGIAQLVVRDVYTNAISLSAGMLARCDGEERYHGFVDALFRLQDDWSRVSNFEELYASLTTIAVLGGVSSERFEACVSDELYRDHLVAIADRDARADEVTATPTIFVNGERFTGHFNDVDALSAAIDAAAEAAQAQ